MDEADQPTRQVRRSTISTLRSPNEVPFEGIEGFRRSRSGRHSDILGSPRGYGLRGATKSSPKGAGYGQGGDIWNGNPSSGFPPPARPHSGGSVRLSVSQRVDVSAGGNMPHQQWAIPPGVPHGSSLPPGRPGHRRSRSVGIVQPPPAFTQKSGLSVTSSGEVRTGQSPPRLGKSKLSGGSPNSSGKPESPSPPPGHVPHYHTPAAGGGALAMMSRSSSVGGSSGALRKSLLTSAAWSVASGLDAGERDGERGPPSPAMKDLSHQFSNMLKIKVQHSASQSPIHSPYNSSPRNSFGLSMPSPSQHRRQSSYAASPAGSRPNSPRSAAAQQDADRVRLSLLQGLFPQSGYSTPVGSPRVGRAGPSPSLGYFGPVRTPNVSDFYRVDPGVMGGRVGPSEEEWEEEELEGGYYEEEGDGEAEVLEEVEEEADSMGREGSQVSRVEVSESEGGGSMVERDDEMEEEEEEEEEGEEEEEVALRQQQLERQQQQQLQQLQLQQQQQQQKLQLQLQQQLQLQLQLQQQQQQAQQQAQRQAQQQAQQQAQLDAQQQAKVQQQQQQEQMAVAQLPVAPPVQAHAPRRDTAAGAAGGPARTRAEADNEERTVPSKARVLRQPYTDVQSKYRMVGQELGRGNFGVITACEKLRTGERFACKSVSKKKLEVRQALARIRASKWCWQKNFSVAV